MVEVSKENLRVHDWLSSPFCLMAALMPVQRFLQEKFVQFMLSQAETYVGSSLKGCARSHQYLPQFIWYLGGNIYLTTDSSCSLASLKSVILSHIFFSGASVPYSYLVFTTAFSHA